jgi:ribonucleoside-diphosphate reductase alpha chain
MSLKALSDYTVYAKYAKYLPKEKRRETWEEMVERVFDMHSTRFFHALNESKEFAKEFAFAKQQVKKKRVLGAQRILQFGGPPIFKHNAKVFNCAYGYIDRVAAFKEAMYLLLCGCGVGFSVQHKHVAKLPNIKSPDPRMHTIFTPEDSIEGWADCVNELMCSYFEGTKYKGCNVYFDFKNIRPEGALIAGQFKAPGPKGLSAALEKCRDVIKKRLSLGETRLHPIDVYDIIMHFSNAVLSGGVRRSATICLFSKTDDEMMKAKTGNWFNENPQRARSNNSVLLVKDQISKEEFDKIMESTKQFGEPGFVFADNEDIGYNPCVEIGMYPQTKSGISGWQFCNLCEINGKYCDTEEKFYQACRAAAIIGTMQAAYTDFSYLSDATKEITDREALLGVSITGMMDNPEVLLNPEVQRFGALEVRRINKLVAKYIGINQAARTTCVKPAGSTSCVLGTASGIHPHHARRYFRRVQANYLEFAVQEFAKKNSSAVEQSVWSSSDSDKVISFLCEVPKGAITKNTLRAVDLLEKVKLTQQNWVEYGTNSDLCAIGNLRHNVSNTITVKDDEWDEVRDYIFKNRKWFAGISLLSASGDLDYPQAPFANVLNAKEIVEEYGDGAVFASGLIVDGLAAFNNNLWKACENVIPKSEKYTSAQSDWTRRLNQFSQRYFNGNIRKATHCLKHVSLWKTWCDLKRDYVEIDWSKVIEESETYVDASTLSAQACAGGACAI